MVINGSNLKENSKERKLMSEYSALQVKAQQAFEHARRKAKLQALIGMLTGRKNKLIPYDVVRRRIKAKGLHRQYRDDIPLDAIVGSVGRYQDFNEDFFPLTDSNEQRWVRLKVAQEREGLPAIEVYQISDVYFVLDGNHRVSIAREMGMERIDANVQEFRTNIHITPEDDLEEVILKAERAEFMEQTRLDAFFSDLDFSVSLPGRYPILYEHIRVHQYYLGLEQQRDIPFEEAVCSWVENVYLPAIADIRRARVLMEFPGRTETDLYLWLKENAALLSDAKGCSGWIVQFYLVVRKIFNRE